MASSITDLAGSANEPTKTSTAITFVDSHCHFDFSDFVLDRDVVWQDCRSKGLTALIVPGVEPVQWQTLPALSLEYVGIFHAIGLHPWWIKKLFPNGSTDAERELIRVEIQKNSNQKGCVAIGECGLDAMLETPLAEQVSILMLHLELASELSLPLIVHCHKAHNELIAVLKKYSLPAGGVIHGFSGSLETAMRYWVLGFHLGIGGTITYARANKTRNAVKFLPIEAIVLETDAPDMPLYGKQGARNSPANIPTIAQTVAELRGDTLEYIAQKTTENTRRLFQLLQN